ncbi:MAG: pitrilysin family protein [Pseudomonadota bacterium]|nr:pitrilysin family protein [Pseudomonadota bacterium]
MVQFKEVAHAHGAKKFEMVANGLQIILMPNNVSEVCGFQVTYHVGSRNEGVGHTGATHILEHLMFKGSKKFNKESNNNIDQLENIGAILNATTWLDRTNYFEVLPKQYLEQAIAIEADRMRHAFIDEDDRQAEMTVVRNEFERDENSPMSALHKNIWSTAYIAHPYHHNTIGWLSDIENVSIERLKEFYNTFYWPNNATVTVVGNFEEKAVLELISKYFGKITASPHKLPEMYTQEPKQDGPKRVVVKRVGQPGIVAVAFKTPPGLDTAHLHIQLISGVLQMGKSSRLYKRLVAKGLALSLYAEDYPNIDPGLLVIYAALTPQSTHEQVEAIILEEIEKLKTELISTDELSRVKAMIKADSIYQQGSFFSSLSQINEAIALLDWRYYLDLPKKMEKVTAKDIQRTAQTYLIEDSSTTGYFIPKNGGSE